MSEPVKRVHALVVPWPVSQGLRTWCGYSCVHPAVADEDVSSIPEGITCYECRRAMREALRNLNEWVPRLKT